MTHKIIVNGAVIKNQEDERLLISLLESFPSAHDGDESISASEAFRLIDANGDNEIDQEDIKLLFSRGYSLRDVFRACNLFIDAGVKGLPYEPSAPSHIVGKMDLKTLVLHFDKFQKFYWAEGMMNRAASKEGMAILKDIDAYLLLPEGEEMVRLAALQYPIIALKMFDKFAGKPYFEELLHSAVKQNPSAAIKLLTPHAKNPLVFQAMKLAAKMSPVALFKNIRAIKNLSGADELIAASAGKRAEFAVKNAKSFADMKYSDEVLLKIAASDPLAILENFAHLNGHPLADQLFQIAANTYPEGVLLNFKAIKHYPKGVEVFKKIANELQTEALVCSIQYVDEPAALKIIEDALVGYEDIALAIITSINKPDVMIDLARAVPDIMMRFAREWIQKPYGASVLGTMVQMHPETVLKNFRVLTRLKGGEVVLGEIADRMPEKFIMHFAEYKRVEGARRILERVGPNCKAVILDNIEIFVEDVKLMRSVQKAMENDVAELKKFVIKHGVFPEGQKKILSAAMAMPSLMMKAKDSWKNLPLAYDIEKTAMLFMVSKDTADFFKDFERYLGLANIDELLTEAAKADAETTAANFKKFSKLKSAKAVLEIIAEKSPEAFLRNFGEYKDAPFATELFQKVAYSNPILAVKHCGAYEHVRGSHEIFKEAVRHISSQDIADLAGTEEGATIVKRICEVVGDEVLIQTAREYPEVIMQNSRAWSSKDCAKRILQIILAENPELIILHSNMIADLELSRQFLRAAAEADPTSFIIHFERVSVHPAAIEIFLEILPDHTIAIVENLGNFARNPKAMEAISAALQKNIRPLQKRLTTLSIQFKSLEEIRKDPNTSKKDADDVVAMQEKIKEEFFFIARNLPEFTSHLEPIWEELTIAKSIRGEANSAYMLKRFPPITDN